MSIVSRSSRKQFITSALAVSAAAAAVVIATVSAQTPHSVQATSSCTTVSNQLYCYLDPVADAYTNSAHPSSNNGSSTNLWVQNQDVSAGTQATFLKFDLTQVPDLCTKGVYGNMLHVFVTADTMSGGQTSDGGHTLETTDAGWTESAITYNNSPQITSTVLYTTTAQQEHSIGEDLSITLPNAPISTNCSGTLSLVVNGGDTDALGLASKENSNASLHPYLTVVRNL